MDLEPINDILNRSTTKWGIDHNVFWIAPALAVPVLLKTHSLTYSLGVILVMFAVPALCSLKDREFLSLLGEYLFAKSYYDPFK
jgi:hypothetical protein